MYVCWVDIFLRWPSWISAVTTLSSHIYCLLSCSIIFSLCIWWILIHSLLNQVFAAISPTVLQLTSLWLSSFFLFCFIQVPTCIPRCLIVLSCLLDFHPSIHPSIPLSIFAHALPAMAWGWQIPLVLAAALCSLHTETEKQMRLTVLNKAGWEYVPAKTSDSYA